jgi:hypothetical protein
MIRSLRTRHRVIFTALALALPALFAAGLLARRAVPINRLPDRWLPEAPASAVLLAGQGKLWEEFGLATRVQTDEQDAARLVLEIAPTREWREPDALLYWSESLPVSGHLPEAAVLLGPLTGTQAQRFRLPEPASQASGHLILYSLAHQKVLATAELPSPAPRVSLSGSAPERARAASSRGAP